VLDETWIGYNGDTGMATAILSICKAAGFKKKFHFSYFASEESAVIGLVRAGLGVSILPVDSHVESEEVKKIKISRPYFYRNMYMVWNKKYYLSPAAKAFRKYILSII
jgi:DNA-binding transcriptional LysR family regulator